MSVTLPWTANCKKLLSLLLYAILMATLSVLSYNLSQGSLKMKSQENNVSSNGHNNSLAKTFNKITVQNVLSENKSNALNISNNNANAIVKKIKDFGMIGAVNAVNSGTGNGISNMTPSLINASRKRPLTESKLSSNMLVKPVTPTTAAKKPKLNQKAAASSTPKNLTNKSCENLNQSKLATNSAISAAAVPSTPTAGTPGRKGLPLPQAVARRNARERNRVKQVNNGFAALRERIPEEVAEAFEAQSGGGRAALSKKLSKVETLRMAVEYIRSLERLLGFDFPIGSNQTAADSFALIKDEFGALSPGLDEQYDDSLSNYELDEDFVASQTQQADNNIDNSCLQPNLEQSNTTLDMLPNITTLNGLQYIRIPGTNTYQLLTAEIFAGNSPSPTTSHYEDDRFTNIIDTNCQSPRASAAVTTTTDTYASPTTSTKTTTGPTLIMQTTAPARHQENGDHVKLVHATSSSSLSRSPVPLTSSSPSALQQQRGVLPETATTTPTLSPVGNELLLQTCADNDVVLAAIANHDRLSIAPERQFVAPIPQQQQQQLLPARMIKQEFIETDFTISTSQQHSPNNIYQTIIHNQQQLAQQQLLLGQTSMSMSPPLDRIQSVSTGVVSNAPASVLPGYFEQDNNASFYDGVVTFKKELHDVMLDTSNATATLSDESMMEAIDWWEAHTPKSDGGSVIM